MKPILQVDSLSIEFDTSIQRINAVDHVSLQINKGEIVGIIGASGSGKSTIAKTILGLKSKNQKSKGHITWNSDGIEIDLLSQTQEKWQSFRGRLSTIVFQNPLLNLNPSITIQGHFDRIVNLRSSSDEAIHNALSQVGLKEEGSSILRSYPHQISGGQQQRVLIAMTLCQEVELLILDEPLSSLDSMNQKGITAILKKLVSEKHLSILLISHDLNIIGAMSDRIYVLHDGQIIEHGTMAQILKAPNHHYTKELVGAAILNPKMTRNANDSPHLSIKGVSHRYKKSGFLSLNKKSITALKNINLMIPQGHIVGIVGPSGSGKSTLVKILLGIEEIQQGSINWKEEDLSELTQHAIGKRIQMIPQNTTDAFNPRMLLEDQLKEVYRSHYGKMDGFEKVITSLLKDVELDKGKRLRYPSELSGGEVQRMAIVRALIIRPEILVLDESLSALDMIVQKKMIDLLLSLNKRLSMTMIMISHDHRLIKGCCDQVIHLDAGQISLM